MKSENGNPLKIIFSPAKQMCETDMIASTAEPVFLKKAAEILQYLRGLSYEQAKALWECSDKIAKESYEELMQTDLQKAATPAILSYEGIAFRYMAPDVFEDQHLEYVQKHLRILSGLYGVLKPLDPVVPYRLEMKEKAHVAGTASLYQYWGRDLYDEVVRFEDAGNRTTGESGGHDRSGGSVIINLASKEYSRCIESWLQPEDHFLTCVFGEMDGARVVQKGVYVKMARGDMVRFMAENQIEDPENLKGYDRMGYSYREDLSSENQFVFIHEANRQETTSD